MYLDRHINTTREAGMRSPTGAGRFAGT